MTQKIAQKKSRYWPIIIASGLLLLLAAGCAFKADRSVAPAANSSSPYHTPLQVGEHRLLVQIALTDAEHEQGLSGRQKLTAAEGMLFDFKNTPDIEPGFWMKDMNFDLDFIWIDQGRVVGITPNAPAPKNISDAATTAQLPLYYPPAPVDAVLEVNAGWSKTHFIKTGDFVKF